MQLNRTLFSDRDGVSFLFSTTPKERLQGLKGGSTRPEDPARLTDSINSAIFSLEVKFLLEARLEQER